MTEADYYRFYKMVRESNHSDHVRAVVDLLEQVYIHDSDMSVKEFYELKLKFMEKNFYETAKKYNINLDEYKMKG